MKKFLKNPWVLAIGSTVIGGILLSFVMDWINKVDLLSTLKAALQFMGNAILAFLNFELKVWWVLLVLALLFIALLIYSKILDAKEPSNTIPFLNYTNDYVLGYSWEWDYVKNYDGKYEISNLHPVCSTCGMILKQDGMFGDKMKCLRCNKIQNWDNSHKTDARMLIEDNIKKKYFPNQ